MDAKIGSSIVKCAFRATTGYLSCTKTNARFDPSRLCMCRSSYRDQGFPYMPTIEYPHLMEKICRISLSAHFPSTNISTMEESSSQQFSDMIVTMILYCSTRSRVQPELYVFYTCTLFRDHISIETHDRNALDWIGI